MITVKGEKLPVRAEDSLPAYGMKVRVLLLEQVVDWKTSEAGS